MESNKSIWKKNLFSNSEIETEVNFETAHMMHKIMRANNKKKKRSKLYNYKNIETFENIREAPIIEGIDGSRSGDLRPDGTWVDSDGIVERGFFDNTNGSYYVTDASGNKRKYNGPEVDGIPLTPDFWEGLDFNDIGKGLDDPRARLIALINDAEKWVKEFNRSQARALANSLQTGTANTLKAQLRKDSDILVLNSTKTIKAGMTVKGDGIPLKTVITKIKDINYINISNKATKTGSIDINFYEVTASDKDIDRITPYIGLIESIIASYFFTYSLVYATMYIDRETKHTIYIPRFTSDQLKIATLNRTYGVAFRPLVYLFTYALYFSDIMQTLLYDKIPYYFKTYLSVPIYFVAVFFSLVWIIQNAFTYSVQFLRDVIMLNTSNQSVNIMYSLVIFWYVMDFDLISSTFKHVYGAATSLTVKIDKPMEQNDEPKNDGNDVSAEEKSHKKHNCSGCGMISMSACGSCGRSVCAKCSMMHTCKQPKLDLSLPTFDVSGLTKWFSGLFNWFDHINVGGNLTPLYLLVYQFNNLLLTVMSPITAVIYGVFQFIIILSISVPIGGFSCLLILLLMCTSIIWHPFSTLSLDKILNMWSIPMELNEYIQMSFMLNFNPNDPNLSPKQLFEMVYAIGFDFFFTYILFICIAVVLVLALIDFNKNIDNPQLKTNITILIGLLITLNCIPLIVTFMSKVRQDRQMTPEVAAFNKELAEQIADNVTMTKLIPPIGKELENAKKSVTAMLPIPPGLPMGDLGALGDIAKSKLKDSVGDINGKLHRANARLQDGVDSFVNNPLAKMAKGLANLAMNPTAYQDNESEESDSDDDLSFDSSSEDSDEISKSLSSDSSSEDDLPPIDRDEDDEDDIDIDDEDSLSEDSSDEEEEEAK